MNPYSIKKQEIRECIAQDYGCKRARVGIESIDYAIARLESVKELLPKHYAAVELGEDDPDSGEFVYNDHYWDLILCELEVVSEVVKCIEGGE